MRDTLKTALTDAMKAKNDVAVSTIRLILAALKDRDIAARTKGNAEGISDDEILQMLQTMVRQRHESITLFEQGGRCELAEREREEIGILKSFLPTPLNKTETDSAIDQVIKDVHAHSIKDMGKAMSTLRQRYAGRMDFTHASAMLKRRLCAMAS